ncbi:enoyl-CoA hydratase/isomerase family protein [Nocardioides sp. B-3]|uniref:enoyl-CoA hydratase/isomerase family protein n=1 Tax=Nocardioides sp. B-3 TaxID=2895565 RepID=UPI002152213E|nr:enoyl-CoA hydratase/isomerase family protein [Nocardioides sp. B-3]UUZ60163.1 enoyl-CoA hydratase/isomerase family protein [Nocardioides sp. B-3]
MNSLDIATKELLRDIVQQVAADESVRCVVLTGTGRGFCVGQDLKEHIELLRSGSSDELFTTVERHYNPIVTALATMPKPVIAAVNGVAAGAGASLAPACDMRVLADTAGFNFAFAGVALAADTGASYHLPRLVGQAKALELLYFPSTISATESQALGPANQGRPRRRARSDRGCPRHATCLGAHRRVPHRSASRWPSPRSTPSPTHSPTRARP